MADTVRRQARTRVVYIDNEPIAMAHLEFVLADAADPQRHKAIAGCLLQPHDLWERVLTTGVNGQRESA